MVSGGKISEQCGKIAEYELRFALTSALFCARGVVSLIFRVYAKCIWLDESCGNFYELCSRFEVAVFFSLP